MEDLINSKPFNFIFIGKSGSGKGTQSELLIKYLENKGLGKTLYIYTGDEIRSLVRENNSLTAKLAKQIMLAGNIAPSFISVWAWSGELIDKMTEDLNLIMDGVPRILSEAEMIDDAFEFYRRDNVKPLFIETSDGWSTKRLLERGRADDTEVSIKNRLSFFEESVMPAVDYYEKESRHKLIRINGEQSIEDVHKEITKKCFNT